MEDQGPSCCGYALMPVNVVNDKVRAKIREYWDGHTFEQIAFYAGMFAQDRFAGRGPAGLAVEAAQASYPCAAYRSGLAAQAIAPGSSSVVV